MIVRRMFLLWVLFAVLSMTGCFKDDEQVAPHPRGDAQSDTVAMTATYKYQIYYDLDSMKVVATNEKSISDLAFECTPQGWHILLNTADFMVVADLGVQPFGISQDTIGVTWWFDRSDGNLDSTAVGMWFDITEQGDTVSNQHVYAIDRGIDDLGNPKGIMQVIFDSLKNGTYFFRFAPLDGGTVVPASVKKDPLVNFRYFDFDNGGTIVDLQPPKNQWDILFTQYTTLLFTDLGEPYPYLVTGVLCNRNGIEIARDSVVNFASITYQDAVQWPYSSNLDGIGYDWKYYNFETGNYTITLGLNFVVKNRNGYYYKLRFTGFYNDVGQKGYPSFEVQQL